ADKVAKLILYAGIWKGTAEFRALNAKRIENGGKPLPQYRVSSEESLRSDFVTGDLARHPQFEEDVVRESVKEALETDPKSPNVFVEWAKLPILDPARITVPTLILHGGGTRLCGERGGPPALLLATQNAGQAIRAS